MRRHVELRHDSLILRDDYRDQVGVHWCMRNGAPGAFRTLTFLVFLKGSNSTVIPRVTRLKKSGCNCKGG